MSIESPTISAAKLSNPIDLTDLNVIMKVSGTLEVSSELTQGHDVVHKQEVLDVQRINMKRNLDLLPSEVKTNILEGGFKLDADVQNSMANFVIEKQMIEQASKLAPSLHEEQTYAEFQNANGKDGFSDEIYNTNDNWLTPSSF